jgi:type II secretory pathway component PulM
MPRSSVPLVLPAGAVLLMIAPLASVQAPSNAELMAIREQQRQIEELSRNVEALQRHAAEATEKADAAAEIAQQVEGAQDFDFSWGPSPPVRMPPRWDHGS